jgi:glycerate kinase
MKILICPDSFKETLTATEAANAIKEGIEEIAQFELEFELCPIADGGEGTVEALLCATPGKRKQVIVHDPLGRKIIAEYGLIGDTAIIEMAVASGLPFLKKEERNPFLASTYGTGQLILDALNEGVEKIIIGIGGSATNDGGVGMAQALGVRFLDRSGAEIFERKKEGYGVQMIESLEKIDISVLDSRIANTEIIVCSDVTNTLLGKHGASFVYGPQKGATQADVLKLDALLGKLSNEVKKDLEKEMSSILGGGAAGGLGAGLVCFLGAHIIPGMEYIATFIGLEEKIKNADIIITGEGQMDLQTEFGKGPYFVAHLAQKYAKEIYALNGFLKNTPSVFTKAFGTNELSEFDAKNIEKNAYKLLKKLSKKLVKDIFSD